MDTYSHNISSDIAREYNTTDTDLINVEQNFHKQAKASLSGYIWYDHIKKELANTMFNTLHVQEYIDTNLYHDQIRDLYEHLDEKMEIIDAYMTEFAITNEISPWVYTPEMTDALVYIEHTRAMIRQCIQDFKITASKVETEAQRENILPTYQQIMTILSNYIEQIEEYF